MAAFYLFLFNCIIATLFFKSDRLTPWRSTTYWPLAAAAIDSLSATISWLGLKSVVFINMVVVIVSDLFLEAAIDCCKFLVD